MRTEDGSIIQACLNGEPEAFGILVDKYKAGIFAFIYANIHNLHDAQDISQEVFLQAYRNLHSLRRWESFTFWLYRIAFNYCKKWLSQQSKRPDHEFIEDKNLDELSQSSIDSHKEKELDNFVHESIDSLPESYREVLMLHYFGGMNSKDIAIALGASHAAIRHRLSRARSRLKEEIISVMGEKFESHKLKSSFTFRIVEAVKHIRIKPLSEITKLSLSVSVAIGILFVAMGFLPNIGIIDNMMEFKEVKMIPQTRLKEVTEVNVDAIIISKIPISGNKFGSISRGKSDQEKLKKPSDESLDQTGFEEGNKSNPVLDRGAVGAWDYSGVISPSVIFDGKEYKMWYRGHRSKSFGEEIYGVGYANSDDGISWKKYPGNPVLTIGSQGEWDTNIIWFTVIFSDGKYMMWYTGGNYAMCLANSLDGISWSKYSGNPVFIHGDENQWDGKEIYTPSVVFDGREYKMWYTGSNGSKQCIGYATSHDGISWTKYQDNPVISSDEENNSFPNVIFDGSEYKMWYITSKPGLIGYATSYDGISWVKKPGFQMKIDSNAWDNMGIGDFCIVHNGEEYKMWYDGYDDLTHNRIGYASGTDPQKLIGLDDMLTKEFGADARIPYQLSEGGDVKVYIYEWLKNEGDLIRTLDLGYKPAGDYTSKDKAIYWNGKDDAGKPVQSGYYDCVIKAGRYTGSQRIVISR